MEQMEDKDKHMVTESRNRKKLLEEVESVVVSFLSIYQVFHFFRASTKWYTLQLL